MKLDIDEGSLIKNSNEVNKRGFFEIDENLAMCSDWNSRLTCKWSSLVFSWKKVCFFLQCLNILLAEKVCGTKLLYDQNKLLQNLSCSQNFVDGIFKVKCHCFQVQLDEVVISLYIDVGFLNLQIFNVIHNPAWLFVSHSKRNSSAIFTSLKLFTSENIISDFNNPKSIQYLNRFHQTLQILSILRPELSGFMLSCLIIWIS